MSAHSQALLAQARQQFAAFKGVAERELTRERGKCLREHCAQQHKQIDALIRRHPRAVAAALAALFPASKPTAARPQPQQKPPAPKPIQGGMPALTPEQRRTFKQ